MRNLRLLLDTNVMLNYLTLRNDPYLESSIAIIGACARKAVTGYFALHSLSTIWYILRREKSRLEVRQMLERICNILTVSNISQEQVLEAIAREEFRDFEDCLQDECAVATGADYIVTCNIKDFKESKVKAVAPDEMIRILEADAAFSPFL